MERLTRRMCGGYGMTPGHELTTIQGMRDAVNRLAAYEDTGLTPEEVAIVKNIVGRIATADYPHNFQRERSDIAAYMYWITSVMKDAKEWWNGMVTREKGGNE